MQHSERSKIKLTHMKTCFYIQRSFIATSDQTDPKPAKPLHYNCIHSNNFSCILNNGALGQVYGILYKPDYLCISIWFYMLSISGLHIKPMKLRHFFVVKENFTMFS